MFKRITLLLSAALLVATMAMAGLAGPAFADKYDNPAGSKAGPSEPTGEGATDPPGTCTKKQGEGDGVGNQETKHGACK